MFLAEKPKGFPGRFLVHVKNNSEPFVFVVMCAPTFKKNSFIKNLSTNANWHPLEFLKTHRAIVTGW